MTTDEAWRCVHAVCDYLARVDDSPRASHDLYNAVLTIRRADVARILSIEPPREAAEIRADIDAFLHQLENEKP